MNWTAVVWTLVFNLGLSVKLLNKKIAIIWTLEINFVLW